MMVVSPAYGRDYKSAKAVKADWDANKDFQIEDLFHGSGRYVNKQDVAGKEKVQIRYDRLTKFVIV